MEKKEEKKEEIKSFSIKSIIIFIILLCFLALNISLMKANNKKAEAYTNNVVPYANEQITDLTGTTWIFNNKVDSFGSWDRLELSFTSNNQQFNSIWFTEDLNDDEMLMYYQMYFDNIKVSNNSTTTDVTIYENYKEITITGGEDATDTTLAIPWLLENATLQVNEEFYNISYNLQNVIVVGEKPTQISNLEEISIEFQNFNNYELPQNIMVDGASYKWNYETGILRIYDATGNVTITIRAEYISGNYSFIELIDSVVLIPLNTFLNLFNFDIFGVNIYALLTATLTLFVIVKVLLKVFK